MTTAKQGHRYRYLPTDREVLALSSGERPSVAHILPSRLWSLGEPFDVDAAMLEALPMVYFHGALPA